MTICDMTDNSRVEIFLDNYHLNGTCRFSGMMVLTRAISALFGSLFFLLDLYTAFGRIRLKLGLRDLN